MTHNLFITGPMGLLPVLAFLGTLVYLDSYKLVKLRMTIWVIISGGFTAIVCYFINGAALDALQMNLTTYSRFIAPFIEEGTKALIIIYLFRTNRIGFLVDAAIVGFAVGAGFALVENFYYLSDSSGKIGVWIVRGFGTAIMHGGVTAIFSIISQTMTERSLEIRTYQYFPGLLIAAFIHAGFNQFFLSPILSTVVVLLAFPPLMYLAFRQSGIAMHEWLSLDFDADADLIEQINSGHFKESRIGSYLTGLREKFEGIVVVDMLCYLRIYTELALSAKGLLMMRENGLEVPIDEDTRAKFEELKYLELSIGTTGLLAMKPFLQTSRKDLWQLYMLD